MVEIDRIRELETAFRELEIKFYELAKYLKVVIEPSQLGYTKFIKVRPVCKHCRREKWLNDC